MRTERSTTFTWSNWTFGYWSKTVGKQRAWGVDVGPLEVMWMRRPLPIEKQLHPRVRGGVR